MSDQVAVKGLHACAMVLKCSVQMIRDRPIEFREGIHKDDLYECFPRIMGFSLATYGNRLRDCFNILKAMGKHDVPYKNGVKRRFFPLVLDEEGLINHSRCVNCQQPK